MNNAKPAAIAATVLLAALVVFQVLLALGAPLGRFAWGGQYDGVLPTGLRWGSLVAVSILGLAGWVVLARARLVAPGSDPRLIRSAVWVFAGYFSLNTIMNLLSQSSAEQLTMTPVSLALVVCFLVVALS